MSEGADFRSASSGRVGERRCGRTGRMHTAQRRVKGTIAEESSQSPASQRALCGTTAWSAPVWGCTASRGGQRGASVPGCTPPER